MNIFVGMSSQPSDYPPPENQSDSPVLIVSRHVCMERIQKVSVSHEAEASVPLGVISGLGNLTVALNAADGARAWIKGEALQVFSRGLCVLPKGGFLKDSEGVCLEVAAGAWRVRVQGTLVGAKQAKRTFTTNRYEW